MGFGKKDEKDLLDIRGTVTKLESRGKGNVAKATITLDGNWGGSDPPGDSSPPWTSGDSQGGDGGIDYD